MPELSEPATKPEVLELIQAEKRLLQDALGKLTESQMLAPNLDGDRSVKDVLAHIAACELLMVEWLKESYAGLTPQRPAPGEPWDDLDQLNENMYLVYKDRPLAEILAMSEAASTQADQAVHAMTEKDLFDGSRFAWRNGDPMWHMVAANTWWHYKEHREQIEVWRESSAF